jgi:hypothetical protein
MYTKNESLNQRNRFLIERKTMENAMDEYLRKKNCGIASQFFSLQVM